MRQLDSVLFNTIFYNKTTFELCDNPFVTLNFHVTFNDNINDDKIRFRVRLERWYEIQYEAVLSVAL